jgi:hypothetical protein
MVKRLVRQPLLADWPICSAFGHNGIAKNPGMNAKGCQGGEGEVNIGFPETLTTTPWLTSIFSSWCAYRVAPSFWEPDALCRQAGRAPVAA